MSRADPRAEEAAETIRLAFARYRLLFRKNTRRARRRFERREWLEAQHDARERLQLYRRVVQVAVRDLQDHLDERVRDTALWREMKELYAHSVEPFADVEVAETFFNSVTRRIFATVGVDPTIEFVDLDFRRARPPVDTPIHLAWTRTRTLAELFREVFRETRYGLALADPEGDARRVAERVQEAWRAAGCAGEPSGAELVDAVFYRGLGAYLVGQVSGPGARLPLVIALVNPLEGARVDAVLCTESEVSIVFSYTRSYFHVEVLRPSEVVRFLSRLIPRKPVAELYMSLGYDKHGKTEMYRSLLAHLDRTRERFDFAPGQRGMVMIVFAMPGHEYVFKIIRDRFAPPKTTTREDVLRRYQLVFQHDRAGRLVEAQEFEHLTFSRARFSEPLLRELAREAEQTVTFDGDRVAIRHLYIERRVAPLDLYLREADDADAARAVVDYGQAIRDLAATNIFPGDLLLKNFGVTRNGRVIFYDYDELCHVTDCNFRDLPRARDTSEEMSGEPWFFVGESDVFPEEFPNFLGLDRELRRVFLAAHGEVVTADFWRDMRALHERGEVLDVLPYPPTQRLDGDGAPPR